MWAILALTTAIVALVAATAAVWLAYHASRQATATASLLRKRGAPSPSLLRDRGPVAEHEQRAALERLWRASTPHDAPEWIPRSLEYLEAEIQKHRVELDQLRTDPQRQVDPAPVSLSEPSTREASSQSPAARGQPVDLRDGTVVLSRSLAATGSLVLGEGDAPALLYLNESVEIDHLSRDRWSQYFDFGNGDPYRRYRTVEPSRVDWNAALQQGQLLERGRVEAV